MNTKGLEKIIHRLEESWVYCHMVRTDCIIERML